MSYITDADKCPNCGAVKVFSALVCPVCGKSYSESAMEKKAASDRPAPGSLVNPMPKEQEAPKKTDFDPNAAFAKFKDSLKSDDEKSEANSQGEEQVVQEEIGKKESPAEETGTEKRPDESPLNSGLYGERRFRFGDDLSKANMPAEPPVQSTADPSMVPTRYGLDSKIVQEKRDQSLQDDARFAKMTSNTVRPHYEQYKSDMENGYSQPSPYTTPYDRGSFDPKPEVKPSVWSKILPLAAILGVVLVIGFFGFKYLNREKNDNGVAYSKGSMQGSYYTDEWAGVKFRFDDKIQAMDSKLIDQINTQYKNQMKEDESCEVNFCGIYGGYPAVIMFTYSDGSTWGKEVDDFFENDDTKTAFLQGVTTTLKKEPDLVLGSNTYKTFSIEVASQKASMKMYLGARKVGNKLVIMLIYEYGMQGTPSLSTIKKYFEVY
jgi:hypothetical protein